MYFVIESQDQLDRLGHSQECFVQVIPLNDKYHPKLTGASLVYYNDFEKGYLFCVDHSESFSLSIKSIEDFLNRHDRVYLLDKKYHSYFLFLKNSIDLYFVEMDQRNEHVIRDCKSSLQKRFYSKYASQRDVNRIVPLSKHYEYCECLFDSVSGYVDLESNTEFYESMCTAYKKVEQTGILIDFEKFKEHTTLEAYDYSVKGSVIYTYYNMYNLTQRPTNAFNGFNALAIPKDSEIRSSFLPKNDAFLEFDFDSYHLRIIANLTCYEVPNESFHTVLGRQYFEKEQLTEEEYQESKKITFRQLYGGVEEKYKHIDFFSKIDEYATGEYNRYKTNRGYELPTGRIIKPNNAITKYKLFNYVVQNIETKLNVDRVSSINDLLEDKKTKLVLITYDSFLFDVNASEGKDLLVQIKAVLERDGFLVKYKYGTDYSLR